MPPQYHRSLDSGIDLLYHGWANIFCGGPHWRFYCYRGLHARITYITPTV